MSAKKVLVVIAGLVFLSLVIVLWSISKAFPTPSEKEKDSLRSNFLLPLCEKMQVSTENALDMSSDEYPAKASAALKKLNDDYQRADLDVTRVWILKNFDSCEAFAKAPHISYFSTELSNDRERMTASFTINDQEYKLWIRNVPEGNYKFENIYGEDLIDENGYSLRERYSQAHKMYGQTEQ